MTALFRLIVRHEWRLLAADCTATVAVTVFVAALTLAAALGLARLNGERRTVAEIDARVEAYATSPAGEPSTGLPAWGPRHPDFVANDRGTLAALPPAPLEALAVGHSDLHARHFKVTALRRDRAMASEAVEAPLALMAGPFDVLFVLIYLLPLLLLALCADLTSGERERGTLRFVLAQPVSLRLYVGAKVFSRAALLLVPATLVPPLILAAGGGWPEGGAVRLAAWSGVVLAYGSFWCGVAVAVNARGATGAANAFHLAVLWLLLAVVVPSSVNLWITRQALVPSGVAMADAARAASRDALLDGSRVLGHFLEDHPTAGIVGPDGMQQYALLQSARDDEIDRRLQPIVERYEAQVEARRALATRWAAASPSMLAQAALVDLAGTSGRRHRTFVGEVEAFRLEWRDYFRPLIVSGSPLGDGTIAAMPRFSFREPPAWASVAGAGPGGLLAIGALALLALGFWQYGRAGRDV